MKKPTGKTGPVRVNLDNRGEPQGNFERVEFPSGKEEIEEFVVSRFLENGRRIWGTSFPFSDPRRNPQDDFDFSIQLPRESAYLELMEVAPSNATGEATRVHRVAMTHTSWPRPSTHTSCGSQRGTH